MRILGHWVDGFGVGEPLWRQTALGIGFRQTTG